jgi:hypothetical protein
MLGFHRAYKGANHHAAKEMYLDNAILFAVFSHPCGGNAFNAPYGHKEFGFHAVLLKYCFAIWE